MPEPSLAVQLYTLRSLLEEDLDGTLAKLAATGVEAVETAGFHGRSGAEFARGARRRRAAGRAPPTCGSTGSRPRPRRPWRTCARWGRRRWSCRSCRRPSDAAEADAAAARIAAATAPAVEAGVRVAYHNHHFEFSTLDDGSTLVGPRVGARRRLAAGAGRGLAARRRAGPRGVLREHAGRCPLVHAKDVRPVGTRVADVPVGDGVLDWPGIVAAAREGGTEWLVAEFDTPTEDTLGDIGRSLDALRRVLAAA